MRASRAALSSGQFLPRAARPPTNAHPPCIDRPAPATSGQEEGPTPPRPLLLVPFDAR